MKIHFFQYIDQVYRCMIISSEGAEPRKKSVSLEKKTAFIVNLFVTFLSGLGIYVLVSYCFDSMPVFFGAVSGIGFALLFVHELGHMLYMWLARKKINDIFLLQNCKYPFHGSVVSIQRGFSVYRRHDLIFCSLFPLLLFTGVPLLLAALVPPAAPYCYLIALLNFFGSTSDMKTVLNTLFGFSKGEFEFSFFGWIWSIPSGDVAVFRVMYMKRDSDVLIKRQFVYENKKLKEVAFVHSEKSAEDERKLLEKLASVPSR